MNKEMIKLGSMLLSNDSTTSPELCDFLGNKAAQMAVDANIPLSDAVVKVAHNHPGLNNTHLTNICQFANNEYFRKVAEARKEAGENLVFEYPLADPPEVVKQINTSAQPKLSYLRETDYDTPPADHVTEKVAAADPAAWIIQHHGEVYSKENPIAELGRLREDIGRVQKEAQTKLSSLYTHCEIVEEKLYKLFKQAMLSRIPVGHVAHLWQQHSDSYRGVEEELGKVANRLVAEEPLLFVERCKTAGQMPEGTPDTSHSLFDTYNSLRTLRGEIDNLERVEKISRDEYAYVCGAEQRGLQFLSDRIAVKRIS